MFAEGIIPIGDGMLDVAEEYLKGLLVADDINEIYDVEQTPFARGKFAAVRRAIHKRSGVHFAAKFLKRRRRAQSSDKEIKHEIAVLMLCSEADNIVKLNAVHESRSDTALLLELATGGELQTLLDNEECLSEAQARMCMREVLKALQFLHKRSIAHLDLKPQNILLVGEHIEDGLKLCDFGISRVVAEGTNVREIVGTPDYVAPEVLQYEPLSLLTDIWSVGVLTYVLLSGFSPFGGETKQETFLNISQCALTFPDKLFEGVSSAAIDFIHKALRVKPNDRMTAAGCLEHIWLKDECSIDRHILSNVTKQHNGTNGTDAHRCHDDDDDDANGDDDDDEVQIECDEVGDVNDTKNVVDIVTNRPERPIQAIIVDNSEENTDASSSITINNDLSCEFGKANDTKVIARGTTAIITPLYNVQQRMEETKETKSHQQMLHITVRRHSSGSNKENTFSTSKKSPTVALNSNAKTTLALPSLMINGEEKMANSSTAHTATVQTLFPDAPTTPKVIRKAPTNDNSPTSVKALVKKFQLEGGDQPITTPEFATNGGTRSQSTPLPTAATNCKKKSFISTTCHASGSMKMKYTNGHLSQGQRQRQSLSPSSGVSTAVAITNNARRASEPLTGVHPSRRLQVGSSSAPVSVSPSSTAAINNSYKTTCVYCLTCSQNNNNTNNNNNNNNHHNSASTTITSRTTVNGSTSGCRHSSSSTVVVNTKQTTTHLNSNSQCLVSGSGSGSGCSSLTSIPSGSGINSSTPSTLLFSTHHRLLNSHHTTRSHHHQHHHHHHHHHHMIKSATATANGLSLDQGIIC